MKKIDQAFFARPWAVHESMLLIMNEIVGRHLRGEKLSLEAIEAKIGDNKKEDPGYQVINGNAVVPVYGIISKRMSMFRRISSSGTSTQDVKASLQEALADPQVKQILLDIDSPGGSVDGTPELADYILGIRGKKPILAYASGQMCSAAYWIGSAADKIYATRSTMVGSIGVYSVVSDYSVQNHNDGIKTEVISAGRYKAAGHGDKPFTAEDRSVIQEEINTYYDLFVEAVAKNRGLSMEEAKALADGRVHIGKQALDMHLIDGIAEIDSVLSGPVNDTGRGSRSSVETGSAIALDDRIEGKTVQTSALNSQEEGNTMKDVTLEQLRTARPDLCNTLIAEGKAEGVTEGKAAGAVEAKAAGVAEERARVLGIVESANKEFKGMGMETVVETSIKDGKSTVEALADMRGKRLTDLQAQGNPPPGADAETQGKDDVMKKAEEYQAAHKCSFVEAMRAVSPARKQEAGK